MVSDFQEDLLKYFFQKKESKVYAKYLDKEIFDSPQHQVIFDLWLQYVEKYRSIPSKGNFKQFFEDEWVAAEKRKEATDVLKKSLLNTIALAYNPYDGDTVFVAEQIVLYAQRKLSKKLIAENADKIGKGNASFFAKFAKQVNSIANLAEDIHKNEMVRGGYYTKEPPRYKPRVKVHPFPYYQLNRMTSSGGYYAPQLIVFAKGPKAYGTGFLLRLAKWSVMSGRKVFFADTENGLVDIYTRFDMTLLECEEHELPLLQKELTKIKAGIAMMGGEFKAHFFGARASMQDLDDELGRLRDEEGFVPDEMYNDYIDKFNPKDQSIKENRFKLRAVYEDQANINAKYGIPCLTISPITIDEDKDYAYYTMRHLAEDKHKMYNAHAVFWLCSTSREVGLGIIRVGPMAQRKGLPFLFNALTTCVLKVDRAKSSFEELNSEAYLEAEDPYKKNAQEKANRIARNTKE